MLRSLAAVALLLAATSLLQPADAQSQDFFIPGQAKPATGGTTATPKPPQKPVTKPGGAANTQVTPAVPLGAATGGGDTQEVPPPQLNVQLPPPPELPQLPKGEPPPVAVIGVLGVPEVMRASIAGQMVEKVIGERRAKLNEDVKKEQAIWSEMQQALGNDRPKLSAEQVHTRDRELQERIATAQRHFRDRNRVIQEAAQYALAQIERTLIAVIKQVADARGMNLVLHRAQVALNVNQFDITDQVAEQLNKIQPTVVIPPDGVSPAAMPAIAGAADGSAPAKPTPASAPVTAPAK